MQWDKRYGGTASDELQSLHQTTDGGYILGGWSASDASGDKTQADWTTTIWNSTDYWVVKKIDATSVYGAYRIIVAQNKNNGNLVYDFYFKNKKDDLDKEEIEDIRSFLEDCKDEEYFDSLQKLSDIQ